MNLHCNLAATKESQMNIKVTIPDYGSESEDEIGSIIKHAIAMRTVYNVKQILLSYKRPKAVASEEELAKLIGDELIKLGRDGRFSLKKDDSKKYSTNIDTMQVTRKDLWVAAYLSGRVSALRCFMHGGESHEEDIRDAFRFADKVEEYRDEINADI